MEFLSTPWWSALLAIILIDLVLAGDNAIVIALAARALPKHLQKKAIVWGTVGAIVVRSLMTIGVVWLLKIPGLLLVGGLGLLWIAYKLIANSDDHDEHGVAATTFWGAMKTIIVADALMGVDNVLGVAGIRYFLEAAQTRLRPILMTTATTVLGLVPMLLGGEGNELRAPMALTVIAGLCSSTLLTLVVIPVLYYSATYRKHEPPPTLEPGRGV